MVRAPQARNKILQQPKIGEKVGGGGGGFIGQGLG